jgi:hypothetical protein
MKTLSLLLTAALWAGAAAAATIDDFDVNQPPLTAPASASASATQDGPVANLLGGERDLRLTESTATGTIAADVSKGVFSFSAGPGASGTWGLSYDGNDNDADTLAFGLGANLTTGGDNAFLLGLNSLTGSPTITLEVFSSATDWSTFTLANPALLPTQVRIPFSAFTVGGGAGANFASAGAIQVKLSGTAVGGQIDFLRTGSATGPTPVEATLTDVLLVDNDNKGKASPGDTLRYVVRIANTSVITRTGVQYAAPAVANASAPANLQVSPLARDEGAAGSSVPGNPFHTPFNTTLTVNNGDPDEDLLNNDYLGAPAAVITKFGGGTFGGTVDSQNAGATATSGGHSLTVNADGSFTYAPPAGFTGPVTFEYRLANASGTDTATVTLAVGVRPSAFADAHDVTGNVQIDTSTGTSFSVLDNDTGDNLTITPGAAGLGTVSVSPNGQFTYTPPRGKATGTDSFTYTIANGFGSSGPVTVTLNFANIVWFIDGSAGAGDGRSASPYNTLAAFNAVNNGAVNNPGNNRVIILRAGTYDNNDAAGALQLLGGQRVIGDGWSGTFNAAAGFSLAEHSVVAPFSGTGPVIQNTAGSGIFLASENQLRGLTVGNTPNDYGYKGGAVGNLTIAECSKIGTGGAMVISTSGSFGANVQFDTLESTSSGGANLFLVGVTGTLSVTSGGSGFLSSVAGSEGIFINGGSVNLTYPGNISKGSGIQALVYVIGGHTGTLTFSGTLSATSGTGLQFDNADGTYNFNGTTTLNGGNAGVDIVNGSSGNFTFASGTSITGPSGAGFLVSSSTAGTIIYNGTITKNNAGRAVDIQGKTGGSVTFGGAIAQNNSASTGIFLANNTGGTIGFTGAISLNTAGNAAFTASGGGTVTATGSGSTLTTTTATALDVANTTIGGSGLTFQSITAGTGASSAGVGINLNNTGPSGGLTVTGTGGAGSGGTIQRKTGADGSTTAGIGIYLNNTRNVSLSRMQLNDFDNFAIRGANVVNFTLANSVINGVNGTSSAADESAIYFTELTGSAAITGSTIANGYEFLVYVVNTAGTLNRLTLSTTTINGNHSANGDDALHVEAINAAVMNVTVQDCTFTSARGDIINVNGANTSSIDLVLRGNRVSNNHPNILSGGGGLTISSGGTGSSSTLTYDISCNTFRDAKGNALTLYRGSGAGTMSGTVFNNSIGVAGLLLSGSSQATAIKLDALGSSTHTALIKNNLLREYNETAIWVSANAGNSTMNATIIGNTSDAPPSGGAGVFTFAGLYADLGALPGDNNTLNLKFGGAGAEANNFVDGDPFNFTDISLSRLPSTTFNLTRGVSGSNDATVITQANNTAPLTVSVSGTITPVNTVPTLPAPISEGCSPP